MKNRLFLKLSLVLLVIGAFVANGCKDTATDPGYSALAEIRFADYHQVQPIQVYMYPQNATPSDSASKTATAMTYGLVTPYFNNIPTNRTAGETYHLVAKIGGSGVTIADDFITLMPGDKKTWLISGNDGKFDHKIIDDNHPATLDTTHAYFRFLNVSPDYPGGLSLLIGDPLNGTPLATAQQYQTVSPYQAIPLEFQGTTAIDTSITFYVVDPVTKTVLSRLSGVGLAANSYHTLTWGGSTKRIPDPTTGNLTLNDTIRIRILDDDPGTDLTLTPPLTFRYNIINALVVPQSLVGKSLDYTTFGGLSIVINNNTVYDYQGVQPFNPVPYHGNVTQDGVFESIPATVPLVDIIYVKMVKPFPGAKTPSVADTNLFRLYANHPIVKSDEIYSLVVFDTIKPFNLKAADNTAPYDSAGATTTVPIPDVPVPGFARVVLGHMLAPVAKPLAATSNNNAKFTYDTGTGPVIDLKVKNPKSFDSSLVVPSGRLISFSATVSTDPPYSGSFTPEAGGIYEVFLVGQRGGNDFYKPRFIIVRVNPKF